MIRILLFNILFLFVNCQHKSSFESAEDDHHLHHNQIPPPYLQPTSEDLTDILLETFKKEIDKDNDGFITDKELKNWIEIVHNKLIQDSVDRQWSFFEPDLQEVHTWEGYNPEKKETLHWDRYVNMSYPDNFMDGDDADPNIKGLKTMYKRAERRWKLADANGDGFLVKDEFKFFIHPEEMEKAKDLLVEEAIEDMDKDANGDVSLEEYMNHLHAVTTDEERSDPSWAQVQQDHFQTYLDKNKDGTLNTDELKEWLIPSYDRHEAEAFRLISIGDGNGDNRLSKDEFLNNHEEFLSLIPPEVWSKFNGDDVTTVPTAHDEF